MRWAASSGNVLRGCLRADAAGAGTMPSAERADAAPELRAWQVPGSTLSLCFRHDELSDLIGFTYQSWHGDDAVRHFVGELERVAAEQAGQPGAMALIALDGENAWEHYPFNGYYFLQGLYAALASHPLLELTTLGDALARQPARQALPHVVAGSWVHGTLATWIGDPDKNAGWDLLVQAKIAADEVLADAQLSPQQRTTIERQLALCESSDWFWWFGDYNPYEAVRDFDRLFRHQLASLYRLLGRDAPAALSQAISVGRGAPEGGGVMRARSRDALPVLDRRRSGVLLHPAALPGEQRRARRRRARTSSIGWPPQASVSGRCCHSDRWALTARHTGCVPTMPATRRSSIAVKRPTPGSRTRHSGNSAKRNAAGSTTTCCSRR